MADTQHQAAAAAHAEVLGQLAELHGGRMAALRRQLEGDLRASQEEFERCRGVGGMWAMHLGGDGGVCVSAQLKAAAACSTCTLTMCLPPPSLYHRRAPARSEKAEMAALHHRAKRELADTIAALQAAYANARAEAAASYRLMVRCRAGLGLRQGGGRQGAGCCTSSAKAAKHPYAKSAGWLQEEELRNKGSERYNVMKASGGGLDGTKSCTG